VHSLRSGKESPEERWSKVIKSSFNLVAHEFENFFDLSYEDDLFGWTSDRPVFKKTKDKWYHQCLGFLKVVLYAQLQLGVVSGQRLDLVQWDEDTLEEFPVFRLEWCGQPRCDG